MTIQITINDTPISVPQGTTVLQAAQQAGIHIPTLCDHPHLSPYGGCRLCVVEVKGARVPIAACTLPATEGMSVQTDTPALRESRATILNLLFSERNHFCPFCQVSGNDCELQQAAYGQDMTHWDIQPQWQNFPVDTSHPHFILDHNRCILCRRCLRACAEMPGNFTINVEERGAATMIVADNGVPFGESSCVSCGSCVQVCPTGALIDRQSAYLGQNTHLDVTPSICLGCSVGCGITIHTRSSRIVKINGDWNAFNNGTLCKLGRFTPLEETAQRVLTPLVRQGDTLVETGWDTALAAARRQPGQTWAGYASARLPVEALAAFQQLFTPGSAPQAQLPTGKIEALRTADCVLVVGADLAQSHEVLGFMIKRSLPKGARLVVIDPNPNPWDELAQIAIKPQAGEDPLAQILAALQSDSPATPANPLEVAAEMLAHAAAPAIIYQPAAWLTPGSLATLAEAAGVVTPEWSALLKLAGKANGWAAAQLGLAGPVIPPGANAAYIALGDEQPSPELLAAFENIPFLVVQSAYQNALTERANIVLPAAAWAEQTGHYIRLDGCVQHAQAALAAPEEARSSADILSALAETQGITLDTQWQAALALNTTPA